MKNEPMMKLPISTWLSRLTVEGLKTTAQKSVISARMTVWPSMTQGWPLRIMGTIWWPAGVCCQLLATTIQTEEKIEPSATMQVEKKCIFGLTRSQPKTSTARKPDSRKNAKMPSAARAEPNTSPTNRE